MNTFQIAEEFLKLEEALSETLSTFSFPETVAYVYNPLIYANIPHQLYVRKYCQGNKKVLFVGMNPGPFGMAQTGVPFGEVALVKEWLGIEGEVIKPHREHPKRPIQGFQCRRSEVSGQRFWSFFKEHCNSPETFFHHCFVYNYCPLMLTSASGKNITPSDLPSSVRKLLELKCDATLRNITELLKVDTLIGVGKYAYDRSNAVVCRHSIKDINVEYLMHPSPINPAANKGWKDIAFTQLKALGTLQLFSTRDW